SYVLLFRLDDELDSTVGFAKRSFGSFSSSRAAEYESEITCAFRRRLNFLCDMRADDYVFNIHHAASLIHAFDLAQYARAGNWNHHHACRLSFSFDAAYVIAERVANQHLFERNSFAEFERTRAQPADGARSHFNHPRTVIVYAQFCVHRAFRHAHSARRRRRSLYDLLLSFRREARGSHI